MWETEKGAADFDFAGSLCHGWSALPVYYHQAVNLGIIPTVPGFKEFDVAVYPSRLYAAEGTIPTPFGPISIKWQRFENGLNITMRGPAVCRPYLKAYPEAPVSDASYNGQKLMPSTI